MVGVTAGSSAFKLASWFCVRPSPTPPVGRARNGAVEGPVDGRRPPRHRQDLQPDGPRAKLAKLAPQFDWNATLAKAGLGSAKTVIVTEPSAVAGAGKILASTPLSTWKEWLAFRFVSRPRDLPAQGVRRRALRFLFEELSRRPAAARPLEARRSAWSTARSAKASAQIYVQRHYPAESERQMGELIANIRAAPIRSRSQSNSWMDDADPQGGARTSSPRSSRASATRSNISTIRR